MNVRTRSRLNWSLVVLLLLLLGAGALTLTWMGIWQQGHSLCQEIKEEKKRWLNLSVRLSEAQAVSPEALTDLRQKQRSLLWNRYQQHSAEEEREQITRTFREAGFLSKSIELTVAPTPPETPALLLGTDPFEPTSAQVFVHRRWRVTLAPAESDGRVTQLWDGWTDSRRQWLDFALKTDTVKDVGREPDATLVIELTTASLRPMLLPERTMPPISKEENLDTWLTLRREQWWIPRWVSSERCVYSTLTEIRRVTQASQPLLLALKMVDELRWLEEAERQILLFQDEINKNQLRFSKNP